MTGSLDLLPPVQTPNTRPQPPLDQLKKEIWSKKEKDEILTVMSKRSHKKIQSSRKQSTPVGGLEMIVGGFSWKKNRKQSENIIFNSMDGWKERMTVEEQSGEEDFSKISKSTVFSSNLGIKKGPHPNLLLKKFEHCSTKNTEKMLKTNEVEVKLQKVKQNSQINILSNETNYMRKYFFQNGKEIDVASHIKVVDSENPLNLQSNQKFSFQNILSNECLENKGNYTGRSSLFGLETPSKSELADSFDRKKQSDVLEFTVESERQEKAVEAKNKEGFSLAQQNRDIQKRLKMESAQKEEKNDFLLSKLEMAQSEYESPKSDRSKKNILRQDTPILNNFDPSRLNSQTNLSEFTMESSQSKNPISATLAPSSSTSRKNSSNHLKMRIYRKKLLEKAKSTKSVTENLKSLNNLIRQINEKEPSTRNFSQLDVNLMKTLSKSMKRSKLFLNTRSRYEFVKQENVLQPSDIICGPQDLPGTRDRNVLSIMNLIKDFLAPSQNSSSERRNCPSDSEESKVKISF